MVNSVVKKNRSLLNFRMGQQEIWQDIMENEYVDYAALFAHRRYGKTHISAVVALTFAAMATGLLLPSEKIRQLLIRNDELERDPTVKIYMPYSSQSATSSWLELKSIAERWQKWVNPDNGDMPFSQLQGDPRDGIKSIEIRLNPKRITFTANGRTCRIDYGALSLNPQAQRGSGADLIIVDEIADVKWDDIIAILLPMLKDSDGIFFGVGTSKANLNTKQTKKALSNLPRSKITVAKYSESLEKGWITQTAYDKTLAEFGNDENNPVFLQEFEAVDDIPVVGSILASWKQTVNHNADLIHLPTMLSVDIGTLPYTVLSWYVDANDPQTPLVLLNHHEYWNEKALTSDIAIEMANLYPNNIQVFLPHDSTSRVANAINTNVGIWRQHFSNVNVINKTARVADRIRDAVEFCNRVRVLPNADQGMLDKLNNWRYAEDGSGKPCHDRFSHIGDAFNMGIIGYFRKMHNSNRLFNPSNPEKELTELDKVILKLKNLAEGGRRQNSLVDVYRI